MAMLKITKHKAISIAVYAVISLVFALVLFHFVGVGWAFFGLFALWVSGNMVAWFNRHPPPPHKLDR